MKSEKQVVSLELSKKLRELGVKQDSLFHWFKTTYRPSNETKFVVRMKQQGRWTETCSAFTVAELGEMLWNIFEKKGWNLLYESYGEVFDFKGTQRIGELGIINLMRRPDMAAKMLIYLLENNLISSHKGAGV